MAMKLPPPVNQVTGEPSWRWRRIAFFLIVGFCMLTIWGLGYFPPIADTKVNQTVMESSFWLIGMMFLLYGGYSGAQDLAAILVTRSGRPYADNVQSVPPAPPAPVTVVSDKTTVTGGPVVTQPADPNLPE